MINIAICDDEAAELIRIENIVQDCITSHPEQELSVSSFLSPDELLEHLERAIDEMDDSAPFRPHPDERRRPLRPLQPHHVGRVPFPQFQLSLKGRRDCGQPHDAQQL